MKLAIVTCLLAPAGLVYGQNDVFLDYTNFQARLNDLAGVAGVDNFSGAEVTQIQAGIKSKLETMYSAFDGLSFSETDPGGTRSELVFGLTGGGLGVADHIDFFNRTVGDTARVFTASFGFILDEFSGSTNRSIQINQLTAALAGTAAHELGHNLGLRHHDAHGGLTYTGTAINTGGVEDLHVMATGSTGLNEVGRELDRTFSTNSLVKLAYADGTLLGGNPVATSEIGDAGDTIANAQEIDFESIAVAGRFGEVVTGTIGTNTDVDIYKIELEAGSLFTADINNDYASGFSFNALDTIMDFLDSNGNVLFSSDDTLYSTSQFGAGTTRSLDSILYNINISLSGTYYVRLESWNNSDSGDYQLLMHSNMLFTNVPEPTSATMFLIGVGGFALRRRKRA